MIVIRYEEGLSTPRFVCDVCGDAIGAAGWGAAVIRGDGMEPLYVHKGRCHDVAEALLLARGVELGWIELNEYLIRLLEGVGYTVDGRNYDRSFTATEREALHCRSCGYTEAS